MIDNISVKKLDIARLAVWIVYSLAFIITGVVLMGIGMLYEGLFFLIPGVCSVIISLSFYPDKSNGSAIAAMIIRMLFVIAAILTPSLIWYLTDAADNVNVFYLFVAPAIVLGSYIISIVFLIVLAKSKDKHEQDDKK